MLIFPYFYVDFFLSSIFLLLKLEVSISVGSVLEYISCFIA
jgi:hypothetical protein